MIIQNRHARLAPPLILCAFGLLLALPFVLTAKPPATMEASTSTAGSASLIAAVKAGRIDTVQALIKGGADVDARVAGEGTALTVASKMGDIELVDTLLRLGADVNQATRGDGNPLIMAALQPGNLQVVKRLVSAGADVNAIVVGDETPLISAARSGDLQIVKYLVEHGADVNLGVIAAVVVDPEHASANHMQAMEWRSPLNQARTEAIKSYLIDKGARR